MCTQARRLDSGQQSVQQTISESVYQEVDVICHVLPQALNVHWYDRLTIYVRTHHARRLQETRGYFIRDDK